jgi:addiction module HigA family antidote
MTLATDEFISRFVIHVLPHGLHRIRHYGLLLARGRGMECRDRGLSQGMTAMSIKSEDLDTGRVGFADVSSGKRLPLIHPGEILHDDFLELMKISVYTLAKAIKVPRSRVNDIVLGRRGITADTAFRLARYFRTSPDFWINLQARYELDAADRKLRRRIEREVRPRAA